MKNLFRKDYISIFIFLVMKRGKKGTHVGVILSFVIFMTFIFFIYLITEPAIKVKNQENSIEYLINNLIENSSANLTTVSIAITQENPQDCVRLSGFFSAIGLGNKTIVRNVSDVVQSQIDNQDLLIVRNSNTFFKVYESPEFSAAEKGSITPCQQLTQGNGYSLGLMKASDNIFESKVTGLIENHSRDYDDLKRGLKIPQGGEFDFSFIYSNGTEIKTSQNKTIPNNVNIYAKKIPVVYINNNAAQEAGFLNVKIW